MGEGFGGEGCGEGVGGGGGGVGGAEVVGVFGFEFFDAV